MHRTDNVLVEDVVAFNVRNHVFIPAEDGPEINNTFRHNLAILVRKPENGFFAFPRDGGGGSNQGEQRVGGFWMRNVHNNLIDYGHPLYPTEVSSVVSAILVGTNVSGLGGWGEINHNVIINRSNGGSSILGLSEIRGHNNISFIPWVSQN